MAIIGQNGTPDSFTNSNLDRVYVNQYTVSGGDFTISALHAWACNGGNCRLVVYDSTGPSGGPGARLCYTADLACPGSYPTFADVTAAPNTPTTLLNGVAYWIGFHFGSNNNVLGRLSTNSVTTQIQLGATFASGAPNPFTTSPTTVTQPQGCVWLVGSAVVAVTFVPGVILI